MWYLGGRVPGLVGILHLLMHGRYFLYCDYSLSAEHVLANVLVFAFFAHCLCGVSHNPQQIKSSILQHRRTLPVSSFGPQPAHFNHFSRELWCVEEQPAGTMHRTDVDCGSTSRLFSFNLLPWRLEGSHQSIGTFQLPVTSQPNVKPKPFHKRHE